MRFVNLQFLVTLKSITCVFKFIGEYTPAGVSAMQNLIKNSRIIFLLILIITIPYFITKSIIYQQLPENKFAELHKDYNINTVYKVNAFTIMSM